MLFANTEGRNFCCGVYLSSIIHLEKSSNVQFVPSWSFVNKTQMNYANTMRTKVLVGSKREVKSYTSDV